MKHLHCIYIIFILFISCSENYETENIIIDLTKVNNYCDIYFEDSVSFIKLETIDEAKISEVSKIQFTNNKFYILDKKNLTLFIFSRQGKFVNKISVDQSTNTDDTEFSDFQIYKNKIYILSRLSKELLVYSDLGVLTDKYKLDDYYDFFYVIDGNNIFLFSNYSNDKLYNLVLFDCENNKYTTRFLPFAFNQNYRFATPPFNLTMKNELLFTQQYDLNIYRLNNNTLLPVYNIYFNTINQIPQNYTSIPFSKLSQYLESKSVVSRISLVTENEDMLYIVYIFEHYYHLSAINKKTRGVKTIKFNYDNDTLRQNKSFYFPPFVFHNDYAISHISAIHLLDIIKEFSMDKIYPSDLKPEDNPIIFFHKLK